MSTFPFYSKKCIQKDCEYYCYPLLGMVNNNVLGKHCYKHNICNGCKSKTGWKKQLCIDCDYKIKIMNNNI